MAATENTILDVRDLVVSFASDEGEYEVLDHISFTLEQHQVLGLVGESGCGKSVTALSIMRLLPHPAGKINKGRIFYGDENLLALPPNAMYHIRGKKIAMIFQEPMTALNPVYKIGRQLAEVYQLHFPEMSNADRRRSAVEILKRVGIPAPGKRMNEYPHQLSGGMRQRVMIAMALASKPDILIADEPTTALDVTIQAQILELMKELQREMGMAIIFITHDLGVVANICDHVLVMYAGRIVEKAPVQKLFAQPRHPYTRGLLESIPRLDGTPKRELNTIRGIVPGLGHLPGGCRFRDRCAFAVQACGETDPTLDAVEGNQEVACIRWREIDH